MTTANRIALGTAQFGLDYGITNKSGRVPEAEARDILRFCTSAGIDTFDTAHAYGESELVLGRTLPGSAQIRIITKTPRLGDAGSADEARQFVRSSFADSLSRLQRDHVSALLIHSADDLTGPFGQTIWAELEALKAEGQAGKIGASVYNGAQIDALLERYPLDIIQMPYNALDQRLVDGGQLNACARKGIEVHARSLFLQGLLLLPAEEIPPRFAPLRHAVDALDRAFAEQGLTRLEGLLAEALRRPELHRLVCGVTNLHELQAIILAADRAQRLEGLEIPRFFNIEAHILNPTRWDELDHASTPN